MVDKTSARQTSLLGSLGAPATEPNMEKLGVNRMLDALKRNEATMDATLIQAQYQVDTKAVAEAILARAYLLRRLRSEFEIEEPDYATAGESPLSPKCS